MIEIFLSIASFSISAGGLVAVFVVKDDKKKVIVLSVIVSAIVVTSSVGLYSYYQHEKYINSVQEELVKILSPEPLTFDDLYQNIFPPVSHELLREALYDGIEKRFIGYRCLRLQSKAKTMSVKVFYTRQ
jgi:hypothetical protein